MVADKHKSHWWSNKRLSYTKQVRNSITVHLLVCCAAVCLSVFLVEATQWNVSRQIQQILQICSHHLKFSRGLTLVRPYPEYRNILIIQSACKPIDFTVFAASQCLCTWEGRLGTDFWSKVESHCEEYLLLSDIVSSDISFCEERPRPSHTTIIKPMTQSQLRRAEEEEDVTGGDQALIKKRAKIGRQQKTRVSSRSYQKKKTASPPTTLCQHGAAPATGCNRPSLQETSHLRTIRAASHLPPAQRGAQQTPHSPETSTLPPARPPACLAHCPRGGRVTPLSETKLFKVAVEPRDALRVSIKLVNAH